MPELLYLYLHAGPSAECMPERIPQGEGSGREARTRLAEIPLTRFGVYAMCLAVLMPISFPAGRVKLILLQRLTQSCVCFVGNSHHRSTLIKRRRWTLVPHSAGRVYG